MHLVINVKIKVYIFGHWNSTVLSRYDSLFLPGTDTFLCRPQINSKTFEMSYLLIVKLSIISWYMKTTVFTGRSRICEKGGPGIQMPLDAAPSMKKSLSRGGGGGDSDTFFFPENFLPTCTLWGRGTVRPPYRPPGWKAKKKKKNGRKKGGGVRPIRPPPPPLDPPLVFASKQLVNTWFAPILVSVHLWIVIE